MPTPGPGSGNVIITATSSAKSEVEKRLENDTKKAIKDWEDENKKAASFDDGQTHDQAFADKAILKGQLNQTNLTDKVDLGHGMAMSTNPATNAIRNYIDGANLGGGGTLSQYD